MTSIRESAACVGLSGSFSVLRDYLGFLRGHLPPDPTGATVQVSLLRQVQRLQGSHFHLNVIQVGSDNFTDSEFIQIDYTTFKMRNIYNQVGVGVGRVQHWGVTMAEANGFDSPTTEGQLEDLTQAWTVDNDGLDLFIPFNMMVPSNGGQTLGLSPEGGPCDKSAKGMNGSVVGLFGDEQTARSGAHEIGHYLGLGHRNNDDDNLMCQSSQAASIRDSVELTSGQGNTIGEHCFMESGC